MSFSLAFGAGQACLRHSYLYLDLVLYIFLSGCQKSGGVSECYRDVAT